MKVLLACMTRLGAVAAILLAGCAPMTTTTGPDPALVREFAPTGVLRAGVNFGNPVIAQRDPAGGPPRGVGPSLARELARRLNVPITYTIYDAAGAMAEAGKKGEWDVAFLAVDPARSADLAFSAPYVLIEGTYMVPEASPLRRLADVDREGVRISVGNRSAYHLFLERHIKRATLVPVPTSREAAEALLAGKTDVAANIRQVLQAAAKSKPGYRVFDESFMAIGQAAAVPGGRPRAARYLSAFIEDAKASGFVARALAESGQGDATVAPPAK